MAHHFLYKKSRVWYLTSTRNSVIWDAKTGRIIKSLTKLYTGKWTYSYQQYDEEGRLTLLRLKYSFDDFVRWWKVEYNDDDTLNYYEDFLGNTWKHHWEVPFLHTEGLVHMIHSEQMNRDQLEWSFITPTASSGSIRLVKGPTIPQTLKQHH